MGAVRLDPLTGQAQGNGTGHFMVGDLGALLRYQAYAGVEYAVIEMDVAPGLEFWILDLSYRFLYEPRSASGGDANAQPINTWAEDKEAMATSQITLEEFCDRRWAFRNLR